MTIENEIQKRSEKIQSDIDDLIYAIQIQTNGNRSYQDATNICIFRYLAKLELKIEEMENK